MEKVPFFRAHSCGDLIISSRSKHPSGLTLTGIREVAKLWLHDNYGIKRVITSKEIRKGILCEEDAITMLSAFDGRLYVKNAKRVRRPDIFLQGEADILIDNRVIDIKVPWDAETFIVNDLDKGYEWQLRAYMALYDKDQAELTYVLCDLPADTDLWHDEYRRFLWNANILDDQAPEVQGLITQYYASVRYSDNPAIGTKDRVKRYVLQRDQAKEDLLIESLKAAAEFYSSLTLNYCP